MGIGEVVQQDGREGSGARSKIQKPDVRILREWQEAEQMMEGGGLFVEDLGLSVPPKVSLDVGGVFPLVSGGRGCLTHRATVYLNQACGPDFRILYSEADG